jgi:hypothetical protein
LVNKFRKDLKERIKTFYVNHETWNTPHLSFKDNDICIYLFGIADANKKGICYTSIRYMSQKAEDLINDRMHRLGEDFYIAKDYVKFKMSLPLLIKVRGWGWREPDFEDLDDDQKKRFEHHKKSMNFSQRRSKRIKEMKDIQEKYQEYTKK